MRWLSSSNGHLLCKLLSTLILTMMVVVVVVVVSEKIAIRDGCGEAVDTSYVNYLR